VSSALPPEHPDDDFLADLAADVLPTHQARTVEAHVMACPRCTSLLTDAEQVRNLLLTDVPGPMPADVLARIEQALQIEVTDRDGRGDSPDPTAPVRVISPWEDTTTIEALEVARKRQTSSRRNSRSAEAGTSGVAGTAYAAGDPPTTGGIAAPRVRGPRLARSSRGPSRSRRDLRQEVRDVKVGRRGTVLAAAAGTVVLIGLGGFVVVGLFTNREAEPVYSSASSLEAAPQTPAAGGGNGPPVLMTGTDYSEGTLARQAKVLVNQVSRVPGQPRSALSAASGEEPGGSGTAGADTGTDAGTAAGNQSLRDTATLNGCLSALKAGGRRPVAVDLARYDGRDAAIIVLNGVNGGYEVWAVSRDCRPGADGTITFLDLTQQPAATRTE
jgi:hypothetical protein